MNDIEFAEPMLQFTCFDADTEDAADLEEFNRFYNATHSPEVVSRNAGIVRGYRYELASRTPAATFAPRWIAAYEWESIDAAQRFISRVNGPESERVVYSPTPPSWRRASHAEGRLMWHLLGESGSALSPPLAIFLEGIDPAPDSDEAAVAELRGFLSEFCALEQKRDRACARVTSYEIDAAMSSLYHSDPAHPQFCTLYETNDPGAVGTTGVSRSTESGPEAWMNRTLSWQLVYSRISDCIYPEDAHR